MAKTGSISITQGTQEIANNRTYITVTGKITTTGESWRGDSRTGTYTITQNGTVIKSGTFTHGAPASSTTTLFSVGLWVNHKTDGSSGTIAVSYNYDSGWCTASTSTTLTKIARGATISSALDFTNLDNPTIKYSNPAGSAVTSLQACIANTTGTVIYVPYRNINKTGTLSYTFSLTESEREALLKATTGNPPQLKVKFYIKTVISGTTFYNTSEKTFTVSDNIVPTATVTLADTEGYIEKYGKYIQGKTKLKVVVDAAGVYGSTIKSYRTTFEGKTYTSAEFTTDAIVGKDTLNLEVVVTDSRGRTYTLNESIEVYEYNQPKITSIKAKRCQQHNVNLIGDEYLGVLFSAAVTSLDNQNTVSYELDYKKTTDEKYTTLSLEDYANQYAVDGNTTFAADDDAYNIILRITDDFGPIEKKINGPSVSVLVSKLKYNLGLAFGKLAELSGVLDIGFKTRFFGGILPMILEDGAKADEVMTPNKYFVKAGRAKEGFPETEVNAVLDVFGDDEIVKQTFSVISKTNPRVYERVYAYADESWSDWICLSGDFVIEQGVSGIWIYRKWNSGIVECWGQHSVTLAIDTQIGNCYRCATQYVTLPFMVYNMQHFVDCTDLNTWASNGPGASSGTTLPYLLWRGATYGSYTWYTKIFVIGRWKQ